MIIAVDGLVATGKGTTAQGVAQELGYTYLDTGAMYRAVTWYAREHGLLSANSNELVTMLKDFDMSFVRNDVTKHSDMYIDGINREKDIRSTDLALSMTPIVTCLPLRREMVALQKEIAKGKNMVADGRDMATVVFPDASYKYFLQCDLDARVKRRVRQLSEQGGAVDEEKIRCEISHRDYVDYLGPNAVNKKSLDAQVIDTTNLTVKEQVARIVDEVRRGLGVT